MLDTEWAGAAPPVCTASVPWSIERLDPFRREKSLGFELREAQSVEISIFDAAGDLVFRSSPSMFPAGRFDLAWSGFDHRGRPARPGFYFARWSFANSWTARRLLLIGVP